MFKSYCRKYKICQDVRVAGHDNSRHFHLDNGYKQVTLVTQEVPAEDLNKMFSKEYVTLKSICHTQRSHQESVHYDTRGQWQL